MTDTITQPKPAEPAEAGRNPHGSHIWYELLTTDAEAAKSFYETVVPGWGVSPPMADHQGYRQIAAGDGSFSGGLMALNDEMISGGARPLWLGYIGVDDVDACVSKIRERGGEVHLPPFDIPGVGRIAMVADPQGNPFYVMRGASDGKSVAFSADAPGHVAWNELTTSDPVAARQFYGELFGWTSEEFMPMGELGEYRFFAHHGTTIGAVSGCTEGVEVGWRYYIRVPSINRAVEAVTSKGGTIAMGPMEVPGGDHIIIGRDPAGAEFALVGQS